MTPTLHWPPPRPSPLIGHILNTLPDGGSKRGKCHFCATFNTFGVHQYPCGISSRAKPKIIVSAINHPGRLSASVLPCLRCFNRVAAPRSSPANRARRAIVAPAETIAARRPRSHFRHKARAKAEAIVPIAHPKALLERFCSKAPQARANHRPNRIRPALGAAPLKKRYDTHGTEQDRNMNVGTACGNMKNVKFKTPSR